MHFSLFDIILLLIIAGFAMAGFWFGCIHTFGSLIGTVAGVYLASRWYGVLAAWIVHITGWSDHAATVIAFTILFVVINRLVGFAFWFLENVFHLLTLLPFLSSLNRLLGLVLGLFEGMITLGIVFYFIHTFPVGDTLMASIQASVVVPYTVHMADILLPLIPSAIQQVRAELHL